MDKHRLYYEIRRRNYTINEFCQKVNISLSSFYRKAGGKTEFTLSEIQTILDVLELKNPMGIFFEAEVS